MSTLRYVSGVVQRWKHSARHKRQRSSTAAPLSARPRTLVFQHSVQFLHVEAALRSLLSKLVLVVMYSIQVPDLHVGKLGKGDAETLLQRAMCSIERYCPLVVRGNCVNVFALLTEVWCTAEWLQRC
jgi:hypothetical protein